MSIFLLFIFLFRYSEIGNSLFVALTVTVEEMINHLSFGNTIQIVCIAFKLRFFLIRRSDDKIRQTSIDFSNKAIFRIKTRFAIFSFYPSFIRRNKSNTLVF